MEFKLSTPPNRGDNVLGSVFKISMKMYIYATVVVCSHMTKFIALHTKFSTIKEIAKFNSNISI